MNELISRYIHEVVRHLPAKDQEEVQKELESNIYDMLPEEPSEGDITKVLEELGAPEKLAMQYKPEKSYLISPLYYHDYIQMLKRIIPIVGIVCLCVGFFLGTMDAINEEILDAVHMTSKIMSNGMTLAISGIFHGLIWITIGYVIAERSEIKTSRMKTWTVNDIPEKIIPNHQRISLSDTIAELVLTLIACIVLILVSLKVIPISVIIRTKDVYVQSIFTNEFLSLLLPMVIVTAILGVITAVAKLIYRKWNTTVFINSLVNEVVSLVFFLILLHNSNMFTTEFTNFIYNLDIKFPSKTLFSGQGVGQPILLVISAIVILITFIQCASNLYKWIKYQWPDKLPRKGNIANPDKE